MRFVATKKYENPKKRKKSELRFARIHDPSPVRRIGGNDVGCLHNQGRLDRKNDPGLNILTFVTNLKTVFYILVCMLVQQNHILA